MLDIKFVKDNVDLVKDNIRKKFQDEKLGLVDEVVKHYEDYCEIKSKLDSFREQRNKKSKEIGNLVREGKKEESEKAKQEVVDLNKSLESLQPEEAELSEKIKIFNGTN